jgi:cell filamentation protein
MSRLRWRWEEKDFGFRFKSGSGRQTAEYYQGVQIADFYVVPVSQCKLSKKRIDELNRALPAPGSPNVVPNPWQNYDHTWDWIQTSDGICFNYAGCLDQEEINRREDEGVARAMEFVVGLLDRPEPVPLTTELFRNIHRELMEEIYPFAGEWRTVALHRGDGPTRWPLPPGGIEPLMDVFARCVLCRSPVLSDDNEEIYAYVSEVMNEVIAIHPFREGNGRTAFIVGNFILMQNGMLPLDVYDRRRDQERYYTACEAGRIHKNYGLLAALIGEWEEAAINRWEKSHGQS